MQKLKNKWAIFIYFGIIITLSSIVVEPITPKFLIFICGLIIYGIGLNYCYTLKRHDPHEYPGDKPWMLPSAKVVLIAIISFLLIGVIYKLIIE